MNIAISLKSKTDGVSSRIRVEKKGITKIFADGLVKSIKLAIPDPKTVPQVAGKDRAQLVIKVDGKITVNEKMRGIKAGLGLVALVNNMIVNPAEVTVEGKKAETKKSEVKKPIKKTAKK